MLFCNISFYLTGIMTLTKQSVIVGLFCTLLAANLGYFGGYWKGKQAGAVQGFENAMQNAHHLLLLAQQGAAFLLANDEGHSKIPHHYVVNQLQEIRYVEDETLAERQFGVVLDTINRIFLHELAKTGDFTPPMEAELSDHYTLQHDALNKQMYAHFAAYLEDRRGAAKATSALELTTTFINDLRKQSCSLLDLLAYERKQAIVVGFIYTGKGKLEEYRSAVNEDEGVSEKLVNEIVLQLCNLISEHSFPPIERALKEFAHLKDFTDDMLGNQHQRNLVKKLITVEDEVIVHLKDEFDRWGPNTFVNTYTKAKVGAGVDLDAYYQTEIINKVFNEQMKNQIVITVNQPQITTTDLEINFTSINQYFNTRLSDKEVNSLVKEGKRIAREVALSEGILEDAERGAQLVFEQLYAPILQLSSEEYDIVVQFRQKNAQDSYLEE